MVYITNVICAADLQCSIDLKELCAHLGNVVYNPKRFPALVWQKRGISTKCLIFRTGKVSCNGQSNLSDAKICIRQYARCLQKLGYAVKLTKIKVVTMSAVHTLTGTVDYNRLVMEMNATYEPELFTAAMLKRDNIHFTIFRTGKVLITGIKNSQSMDDIVFPTILELEMYTNL